MSLSLLGGSRLLPSLRQGSGIFVRFSATANASPSVLKKQMDNWQRAHELFNDQQRDRKNFPNERVRDFEPPTRLGFISEKFFTFFYDKTGVTGPYMLGLGTVTYLLSKEVWVLNHHFAHFLSFWIVMFCIQRYAGKITANFIDSDVDPRNDAMYYKPIREAKEAVGENIKNVEQVIDQNEAKSVIGDIKKENLGLQLEAIYRQRLSKVHYDVKRRLDYYLEMEKAEKTFRGRHMVNWIVNNVKNSITPQNEKEALASCLTHLKKLSQKTPAI